MFDLKWWVWGMDNAMIMPLHLSAQNTTMTHHYANNLAPHLGASTDKLLFGLVPVRAQLEGDTVSNLRTRNGPIRVVQEDAASCHRLGKIVRPPHHFPIRGHEQELHPYNFCHGAPDLFLTKRLVSMMYHSDLSLQFLKLQH